jgi:phosphotransferase system enzyme I (PtsI)
MASEPDFVPLLLALGLVEFSMHPGTLLEVRRAIRACDLTTLRARAPALLRAGDRAAIQAWLDDNSPQSE